MIDTETTGLDPQLDVPYEIGIVLVQNRTIQRQLRLLIDWTQSDWVSRRWLVDRVEATTRAMGNKGHLVRPILNLISRGQAPGQVTAELLRYLENLRDRKIALVGHNVLFDLAMLQRPLEREQGRTVGPCDLTLYDTGLIDKARQLYPKLTSLPLGREALWEFWQRVQRIPARGVRWKLEYLATEVYNLPDVQPGRLHRADYDAYVTHLLFDRMVQFCSQPAVAPPRIRGTRVA